MLQRIGTSPSSSGKRAPKSANPKFGAHTATGVAPFMQYLVVLEVANRAVEVLP
jgi:hypothetical protein